MAYWQDYLLNQCFSRGTFVDIPKEYQYHPNLKRFCTYDELVRDTMVHNGAIAASTLSLLYKPEIIIEFGVNIGWTSLLLSKLNPNAEVHGVDIRGITWFDRDFPTGYVCELHGVENYTLHITDSKDFKIHKPADFFFIDGDHSYEGCKIDSLLAWNNRNVDRDWCIAWDDYHPSNEGVVQAVDEVVEMTGYELQKAWSWYYIGTKNLAEAQLVNVQ